LGAAGIAFLTPITLKNEVFLPFSQRQAGREKVAAKRSSKPVSRVLSYTHFLASWFFARNWDYIIFRNYHRNGVTMREQTAGQVPDCQLDINTNGS